MANYFVGDIQGCFQELSLLLEKVDFNPSRDNLWAVGDLVARGPGSLATLRFFKSLQGSAKVVLGNHDLHLLAIHGKLKRPNPKDQLDELLAADDISSIIDWLRSQPLYQELPTQHLIMTHAGVPPNWNLETLRSRANAVSHVLQSPRYLTDLIEHMYTNDIDQDLPQLSALEQQIYCINALTRMRYITDSGKLDFNCKAPIEHCNAELTPWFNLPHNLPTDYRVVFGHWAAIMGKTKITNRLGLDTGCCWGEFMTLWHLESDQKITQDKLKDVKLS
ncbi:symmetrical bis(5'-nucleosyl)-tetraphosphatase [Shewanella fidelis]|uniref:bis(5'-nucleosyl)-tetraphosphatase (symmetrical) n=1 Tax=Shewanella fidelis TaxID=173509 RepID=A0AAW8NSN9_9GAMM|nr:symmetrical bis(5'-nucleosyl)-tetraphosphatase [Shewanella fidelis]MDR8524964.1 symmetrical bis(5'-nucleosyl)-tetraphosphatase [Shewanella fidelis]MDW4811035.1 symmetrical bis(5'-nucleosyl)-tetraphosphatase [Shewanella fidelis]MDW4815186.1 symmetrical bis(5'-nucleosyl)-tetraphosphatase [Shewanella fidelis]MDW4819276.1 symmetrical bis(5'-nucleosyl)-tetraphosphatase [Shewanella fidelis]MDW4823046.1 symmetrical bis(5'-nucleosyl)-tetraphosphatase [Shewanella fidelis]